MVALESLIVYGAKTRTKQERQATLATYKNRLNNMEDETA
jgi:hypothetical protein